MFLKESLRLLFQIAYISSVFFRLLNSFEAPSGFFRFYFLCTMKCKIIQWSWLTHRLLLKLLEAISLSVDDIIPFYSWHTYTYTDCLARGCLNGWKSRMVAKSTFQKAPNNVKCIESMYIQCTHINCGITPISLSSTHIHTHNKVAANKLVWFLKKLPTSKWISAMSVWDVHSKRREKKNMDRK